jgi:hypothetical protein
MISTMAKATKRPVAKAPASKKTSKSTSKSTSKPLKAGAKPAAGGAKAAAGKTTPLAKTLGKVVGKIFGKDKDDAKALTAKAKGLGGKTASSEKAAKAEKAGKLSKSGGKAGKKKGKKEGFEEDDELLVQEDEMGSEEIPDLSEFDSEETEETEEEATLEVSEDNPAEAAATQTPNNDDEVVLTDAEGRRYCRVRDCDQAAVVEGYCRYHYLLLWKRIQVRRKILADGKLERYVDELTSRYPDKFLEMIRKDLKSEKDFLTAIAELEIDESAVDNEFEDEAQSYIDEVRGLSPETNMTEEEEF